MKSTPLPDFSAAKGRSLLVALSGGADSAALVCMLAESRARLGLTLAAAHVDHCIRGEEGHADAAWCRQLCENLNVPFYMEAIDVPALAQSGEGMETAARRLRYEALRRMKAQANAEWIALAHHRGDQAETVLMHLLRGCGPEGICGMEARSGDLYRPLLNTPKADLEHYLRQRGISWRMDSTNLEICTPRNALRLHGLPALEESYPMAADAIVRYAEAAQCESRFLEKLTAQFLERHLDRGPWGLRIRQPECADEAILRRAIRFVCGQSLSHERLMDLLALCAGTRGRMDVSKALQAERAPGAIYFLPREREIPAPVPIDSAGTFFFSPLGNLTLCPAPVCPIRDDPNRQSLDAAALKGAVLRTRRDGDRIRPLGSGDKLLSDYLTDRRIDRPLRDFIPLVARGNRILWAVGLGISQDASLTPDTRSAMELHWNSDAITSEK